MFKSDHFRELPFSERLADMDWSVSSCSPKEAVAVRYYVAANNPANALWHQATSRA